MNSEELTTRSREQGAATDRAMLAALAVAGDQGLTPGELRQATGKPPATFRRSIVRLIERGLVRRDGKKRIWATPAGSSEIVSPAGSTTSIPALDHAIGLLPAEALRAFVRLQLSAVVARWHLTAVYSGGWPAFIALGLTGTGKTVIARLVARVFGVDEVSAIRLVGDESPGSIFARRERDREAPDGWRARPSRYLELPYLCLDEYDKARGELRDAAGKLLLGDSEAEHEGIRVKVRPTIYVTLNTGPEGLRALHDAYVRRSVVIDTTPLLPLLDDIDEAAHRLLSPGSQVVIPRIDLDRRKPPRSLPDELREIMRKLLKLTLTGEGWRHCQVESIARLTLGRAALTGGDLADAMSATVIDYLTCASTLGHTVPGAAQALTSWRVGGAMAPDPASLEIEAGRREQVAVERETSKHVVRLDFEAMRERRAGELLQARRALSNGSSAEHVVEVMVLRRTLATAESDVRGARSKQTLDAAWHAAAKFLSRARQINDEADQEQQAQARQVETERRQREQQRAHEQTVRARERVLVNQKRQHDKANAAGVHALDVDIKRIERLMTRRRGDPLTVLASTSVWGHPIISYDGERGAPTVNIAVGGMIGGMIADYFQPGCWRSPWDETISYPGTEHDCATLSAWGLPGVRHVVGAVLSVLRQHRATLNPSDDIEPRQTLAERVLGL